MPPSPDFLELAHALLEAARQDPAGDTALLQLSAVFGPMLVSALQLIDRREVVRVSLPAGRTVFQVTSSTGKPYTLYLDLPSLPPLKPASPQARPSPQDRSPSSPNSPLAPDEHLPDAEEHDVIASIGPPAGAGSVEEGARVPSEHTEAEPADGRDVTAEALELGHMACPCTGFAFNSLAGDRNVFCKHILAVLLAHWTGRLVDSHVGMGGIVDLLGLARA
ncbi:hypothetical protein Q5752_004251 [Cryptotrichosporon argae]